MSAVGAPLVVLLYLVPVLVVGLVIYLAVRFGVSHGMRDARRWTPPPAGPPTTDADGR